MDSDILGWILDFVLRQPLGSDILDPLLRVLPLPNDSLMLKKSLLLRRIEFEVSNGVVSESVLTLFEQMEELKHLEASDAIKAAYCAVAVDCTVRFVKDGNIDVKGEYFEAVRRIWRGRVSRMEKFGRVGLISDELLEWKDDLEAAIWDESVCENLVKRSEGINAFEEVMRYVKEENERFGLSFLEFVAELVKGDDDACRVIGLQKSDQFRAKGAALPRGEVQERNALPRRKNVAIKHTRRLTSGASRGAKISGVDEVGDGPSTSKYDVLATPYVNKVQEMLESSMLELQAVVKDPLPDALRLADAVILNKASQNLQEPEGEQLRVNPSVTKNAEVAQSKPVGENQSRVNRSVTGNAEIAQCKLGGEDQSRVNPSVTENVEVAQSKPVGEDHSRVNPSVTKNANVAQSKLVGEDQNGVNPSVTENAEIGRSKPVGEDQNRANPSVSGNANIAQPSGGIVGNGCSGNKTNTPKQSLMERNNTAHTIEWDDSLSGSPKASHRPQLPSPRRRPISPLRIHEEQNLTKRRRMKRWTDLEEDTLRSGIKKFGRGNWKLILHEYQHIFDERTEVDLKDKWRNMIRYG